MPDARLQPEQAGKPPIDEAVHHVLVVIKNVGARQTLADELQGSGLRVTTIGPFGLVEVLAGQRHGFDLMIAEQSSGEMAQFGLPQLARSFDTELPILVLDAEATRATGIVCAVRDMIGRWPLRERPARRVH